MRPDYGKIKAFAFDVDGVFTDGGVLCNVEGDLFRTFDSKDCLALRMASMKGYPLAIITGGWSKSIPARFVKCGVPEDDIYLLSRDKMDEFTKFIEKHGLKAEEVAYVGDDLPDVSVILASGLGVCPCDAVQEVKDAADYISEYPGGRGCVRTLVENVLKAHGDWVFDAAQYKKRY